jgi:hypothetical protein
MPGKMGVFENNHTRGERKLMFIVCKNLNFRNKTLMIIFAGVRSFFAKIVKIISLCCGQRFDKIGEMVVITGFRRKRCTL